VSFYFADRSWPQLKEAVERDTLLLLPVGTVEEHGPHLPVSTDAVIATRVAAAVATAMGSEIPLLVLPTVWTGYSAKEMSRWPGTIRVQPETLIAMLFDVCTSLIDMGFHKIVILDCHGHHSGILNVTARKIADARGIYMAVTSPARFSAAAFRQVRRSEQGGAIHAGEWETSLMLYFGEPVDMARATDTDVMHYHSEFYAGDNFTGDNLVFWSTWGLQPSQTGAYGDPTVATAETGGAILAAIVERYSRFLREFYQKSAR
jgi:creatinine amidohydrolase